jgi:hypothetical protein
MKKFIGLVIFLSVTISSFAQVKIHSHNDYTHASPLLEAYAYQIDEIEIDIFLIGNSLIVAHSKKDKNLSRTLDSMYLSPLASWTKEDGKRGIKTNYGLQLMIDVKENWDLVYPVLRKEIEKYGELFNKGSNKDGIQIVISGSRPSESTFHTYPQWLFFDGLPNVNYAKADLERITMISDNFENYSKWTGVGEIPVADKAKLKKAIAQVHQLKKPIRFWGAPDTVACWKQLQELGVDIINTDKIRECKSYFYYK